MSRGGKEVFLKSNVAIIAGGLDKQNDLGTAEKGLGVLLLGGES